MTSNPKSKRSQGVHLIPRPTSWLASTGHTSDTRCSNGSLSIHLSFSTKGNQEKKCKTRCRITQTNHTLQTTNSPTSRNNHSYTAGSSSNSDSTRVGHYLLFRLAICAPCGDLVFHGDTIQKVGFDYRKLKDRALRQPSD